MNRRKGLTRFGFVVLAICLLFLIISGAVSLLKNGSASPETAGQGDVCEFTAQYAGEILEMKHSVNFIPTGKEHYYLVVSDGGVVRYLVRAKPSWIEKRFDSNGLAINGGVAMKGNVVRTEYEMIKEINELNVKLIQNELITAGETLSTSYYIDLRYREFGLLRIICGVGLIGIGVLVFFGIQSDMLPNNKGIALIVGLVSLGVAVLTIYTLTVGGTGL